MQFELISDSDHDLQLDSENIDDVSSNRLCSQSRVEPVREKVLPRGDVQFPPGQEGWVCLCVCVRVSSLSLRASK